ncbi:MAG: phosphoribosyl-ATP diphosphatase [Clostridiales bacterium]|mgnify:CR=1 FL=1|nr:phosphoribosyl-ATP diphosphatase [Clostridiales bacterium]
MNQALNNLYNVIVNRKLEPSENSYTCYLFQQGLNKILKKCGEECSEVIIATKDGDRDGIKEEICDLLFHLTVLLVNQGITLSEIEEILTERSYKIGNLKTPYCSDPNS